MSRDSPNTPGLLYFLLRCRPAFDVSSREADAVAYGVSRLCGGKISNDRSRQEYAGANVATWIRYVHVIRMWFDFCLVQGIFLARWQQLPMSQAMWADLASHFFRYRGGRGLQMSTLEGYLRMLTHVLVYMTPLFGGGDPDALHSTQFAVISLVVSDLADEHPEARCRRNTKEAWDHRIVDASMQLLLLWGVFGHCQRQYPAWPAYARLVISLFNFLGWRPICFTHRFGEAEGSSRWAGIPVVAFGECQLQWRDGGLVAVMVSLFRTKFNSDPQWESDERGVLRKRQLAADKLTFSEAVDTCPCLAWMVWAIVNGAFGYAPLVRVPGGFAAMGVSATLRSSTDMTADDVDALVASIFTLQPSAVPVQTRNVPMMSGRMMHGRRYSVSTTCMSRVLTIVGVRLGLNPRKCSAMSGRKNVGTAVANHAQATAADCHAKMHHKEQSTTILNYADATARNADSMSLVRGEPMRDMPRVTALAASRNPHPDVVTAMRLAAAARAEKCDVLTLRRGMSRAKVNLCAQNAYNEAFQEEMQRQFDSVVDMPRCGDTTALAEQWFFEPLDCSVLLSLSRGRSKLHGALCEG